MTVVGRFFMFTFILPIRFDPCDLAELFVDSNSVTISLSFIRFLSCSTHWFFFSSFFIFFWYLQAGGLFACNGLLLFNTNFYVFWKRIFSFFTFTSIWLKHALLSYHFFHSDSFELLLKFFWNFNRILLKLGMLMYN